MEANFGPKIWKILFFQPQKKRTLLEKLKYYFSRKNILKNVLKNLLFTCIIVNIKRIMALSYSHCFSSFIHHCFLFHLHVKSLFFSQLKELTYSVTGFFEGQVNLNSSSMTGFKCNIGKVLNQFQNVKQSCLRFKKNFFYYFTFL